MSRRKSSPARPSPGHSSPGRSSPGRSEHSAGIKSTSWRRPGRLGAIGLCVLGLVVAGTVWLRSSQSRAQYQQALTILETDPAHAEKLAESAIAEAWDDYPEAQLLQCRALAALGQWHMALGAFSLIEDTSKCDPAFLFDLGEKSFKDGEWKLAELALQATARQTGTMQTRALELLIQLHLKFHHLPEVLLLCREWQRVDPEAALPWAIVGDLEASAVELGPAIADYREALRRSPPSDLERTTRSSLTLLLVLTGDTVAARREFDVVLKTTSLPPTDQLIYAQLLRLEGRSDEALKEIDSYLSRAGADSESLKQRGIIHLDAGRLEQALADLKESVQMNPRDIGAQHKLAQVYTRLGNDEAAKVHRDEGRRLSEAADRASELKK